MGFVAWLNYLFDEEKHVKNFDAWKLFEAINYSEQEYEIWIDWDRWDGFGDKRYAFISGCEIHYWGEQPKRRLISSWSIMDPSKKKNKARVTLRRYLALVANRRLREKVFGF